MGSARGGRFHRQDWQQSSGAGSSALFPSTGGRLLDLARCPHSYPPPPELFSPGRAQQLLPWMLVTKTPSHPPEQRSSRLPPRQTLSLWAERGPTLLAASPPCSLITRRPAGGHWLAVPHRVEDPGLAPRPGVQHLTALLPLPATLAEHLLRAGTMPSALHESSEKQA